MQTEVLDGGLANGELGVVMAPTGGGKSFFLVNLGFGALAAGKNVIHYTFELSETHVGNRYDSRITGIPTKELRKRMSEAEDGLVYVSMVVSYLLKNTHQRSLQSILLNFIWEGCFQVDLTLILLLLIMVI